MRKLIALILMSVLLLAGMTAAAAEEVQPVKVMGFLYDKCGNCGVTVDKPGCGECTFYMEVFAKMRIELLPLMEEGLVEFDLRNVQLGAKRPEYYAYCEAFGVSEEEIWTFPHFFIGAPENGIHISGLGNEAEIEDIDILLEKTQEYIDGLEAGARRSYPQDEVDALAAQYDYYGVKNGAGAEPTAEPAATAEPEKDFYRNDDLSDVAENDSKIVYVYKPNCEFCKQVKPLLEGLPEQITLPDGTTSRVVFVSLDKDDYDQYQIVKQYYDALAIPEEKRYSPLLIVGDQFYMGYDEIVPNLMNALMAGDGVSTDLTPILEAE